MPNPLLDFLTYSCSLCGEHIELQSPLSTYSVLGCIFELCRSETCLDGLSFYSSSPSLPESPHCLFPTGFYSRACLVMLSGCLRSAWLIHPNILFLILILMGSPINRCLIWRHTTGMETDRSLLFMFVVTFQVSESKR
jgi:hypothetical protein